MLFVSIAKKANTMASANLVAIRAAIHDKESRTGINVTRLVLYTDGCASQSRCRQFTMALFELLNDKENHVGSYREEMSNLNNLK